MTEPSEDITRTRAALRKAMVARRSGLDDETHAALSARIIAHARSALSPPPVVAFCWPIKHEPDVRALVSEWRARGTRITLPVVQAANQPLQFRCWDDGAALAPDPYGIPTPISGDWLDPTLILLPLNGFDAAGYRLGYGGGFYDRTLEKLREKAPIIAIGFAFSTQEVAEVPIEPTDQPLDLIVTESGIIRIG